ncbi:peptide-methionine (R)-S-oxide reductase MsrB [Larsenimonas suaedae]|uniref:Peptide methionine sulfoxide reductase MsrB n=1 Tax=Larsenimonas suaedae TaxID=1851019 RepID=A0ABU1GXY6_9GAMM|nr:peptide-methionine (R)-S-oxide reductase MsrB [Larsenimonas suaedae]MCM2972801.1 peptide-methionine (R)-S-oxide reductase MsrB [Larsenimonas suaedae]MDR5896900.1 peptide-methionine (R)-S-oxide reductase MsrB [Larsenimonas suaedae]
MDKVKKTEQQWREQLNDAQYHVTREAGTERPYTGDYQVTPGHGIYHCICCDAPLFENEHKFESHCGWPSFDRPLADAAVEEHHDTSHGMRRIEVTCRRCDAHLGHVFPDGPHDTTGLRYCINSVALDYHPAE